MNHVDYSKIHLTAASSVESLKFRNEVEERSKDVAKLVKRNVCAKCGGEIEPGMRAEGVTVCYKCGHAIRGLEVIGSASYHSLQSPAPDEKARNGFESAVFNMKVRVCQECYSKYLKDFNEHIDAARKRAGWLNAVLVFCRVLQYVVPILVLTLGAVGAALFSMKLLLVIVGVVFSVLLLILLKKATREFEYQLFSAKRDQQEKPDGLGLLVESWLTGEMKDRGFDFQGKGVGASKTVVITYNRDLGLI